MTWVKICGMTNLEDAMTAVEAGADAVGFVFYRNSPRNITIEAAQKIVKQLPDKMEKVGVFVDAECERIRETAMNVGLTAVQLHGERSRQSVLNDFRPVIECAGVAKLISMVPGDTVKDGGLGMDDRTRERLFALLLDSQRGGASGGTGTTFDWKAARGLVQALGINIPVIIAGGLTSGNVSDALKMFQPFGVDVASGVELRPGKKHAEKVHAFVRAVREMDGKAS